MKRRVSTVNRKTRSSNEENNGHFIENKRTIWNIFNKAIDNKFPNKVLLKQPCKDSKRKTSILVLQNKKHSLVPKV